LPISRVSRVGPFYSTLLILPIINITLFGMVSCLGQTVQTEQQNETLSSLGEKQLILVLQDRPQLQSIVKKGNKIWIWLQTAFGDTDQGYRVFWDNTPTAKDDPATATSTYPDDKKTAYIRVDGLYKEGVSIGLARSSEEVLSDLVFELNNVRHGVEKQEIAHEAEAGTITRYDYIRSCTQTEYLASKERAEFYTSIWLPFCEMNGIQTKPSLWGLPIEATFEERFEKYPANFWYPWKYFGDLYDWIAAQRDGDAKIRQGDLDGAIAEYTRAIKLGPRSYYWRGIAEMAKGDWNGAHADIRQSNNEFNELFFWLIQVQRAQKADADRELNDYYNQHQNQIATGNGWAAIIAGFLLDKISERDFFSATSSDTETAQLFRCDEWYFSGMKRLLAGDKDTATQYFLNCMLTKRKDSSQYVLAAEELKAVKNLGASFEESNQRD